MSRNFFESIEPVRTKMIDLQRDRRISIRGFTYGVEKGNAFLTLEFDVLQLRTQTREYICRTFNAPAMDGAVTEALALLNLIH